MAQRSRSRLFTPLSALLFLALCNLLNYFDRGAIAGVLSEVEHAFALSYTQNGFVGGVFMFGFMVFAPIFAHLSQRFSPTRLMTVGLLLWVVSAVATGLSLEFYSLLASRMMIGIGEASFVGLAPAYIDDVAPAARKALWLSVFYVALPVGSALGFVASGLMSMVTWRLVFLVEALLMLPMAGLMWFLPPAKAFAQASDAEADGASSEAEGAGMVIAATVVEERRTLGQSLAAMLGNVVYVFVVAGLSAYAFAVGAISFWASEYLINNMRLPLSVATTGVGALTVLTGLVGTFAGGALLDAGTSGRESPAVRSTAAIRLSFLCALGSIPALYGAFAFLNRYIFFVSLGVAELCLFASSTPVVKAVLQLCPPDLRSFALALSAFLMHLFGDFPSPIIVGLLADWTKSQQFALLFVAAYGALMPACWFCAWRLLAMRAQEKL